MIAFPNAKINIGLNVVAKREDGYHDIETVFYPVLLQDVLEVMPMHRVQIRKENTTGYELEMTGNEYPFPAQDNLVVKAYLMLAQDFNLPAVDIRLYKHIPSGAGLGGGSSDCAAMISLLNRRFNLHMRDPMMERYAARLGSDCAFFITNTPSLATGRGEILTPISLSLCQYTILLVKPDVHVSTAQAYAGVTPHKPDIALADAIHRPVSEWKDCISNDFEPSVFSAFPILGDIKSKLYDLGAEYASMTGSGSTIFGLFRKPFDNPQDLFPGMFVCQREMC